MSDEALEEEKPKKKLGRKTKAILVTLVVFFAVVLSQQDFRSWLCRETNGNLCISAMPITPIPPVSGYKPEPANFTREGTNTHPL